MYEGVTSRTIILGEIMLYPEHEKLSAIQEKSQAIGEFIEWLHSTKKIYFAKYVKINPVNEEIVDNIEDVLSLRINAYTLNMKK